MIYMALKIVQEYFDPGLHSLWKACRFYHLLHECKGDRIEGFFKVYRQYYTFFTFGTPGIANSVIEEACYLAHLTTVYKSLLPLVYY